MLSERFEYSFRIGFDFIFKALRKSLKDFFNNSHNVSLLVFNLKKKPAIT